MMDSFVEAQNSFKAHELPGGASLCLKRGKAPQFALVHTCGHEVTGLKTYRGPKRKEQLGVCSLPAYYVPEAAR
jgi:hypothetical protein